MTNEDVILRLDEVLTRAIGYVDRETIEAAKAAILRLPELPPLGSVEVRIAVAVDHKGRAGHSSCVPGTVSDEDLMDMANGEIFGPAVACGLATLHIPPRVVPEVLGRVEVSL